MANDESVTLGYMWAVLVLLGSLSCYLWSAPQRICVNKLGTFSIKNIDFLDLVCKELLKVLESPVSTSAINVFTSLSPFLFCLHAPEGKSKGKHPAGL